MNRGPGVHCLPRKGLSEALGQQVQKPGRRCRKGKRSRGQDSH